MLSKDRVIGSALLLAAIGVAAITYSWGWSPKSIIESLNQPQAAVGREGNAFLLADGRKAVLPGVSEIRAASETALLNAAISQGVELTNDRVVGLLKIHHWCGNDSVREHIARIDLADLAVFTGKGVAGESREQGDCRPDLTNAGWNISQYVLFKSWTDWGKGPIPRFEN